MFAKEVYISRRKLLKELVGGGLILLPGNNQSGRNFKDNWYPFRQDSSFLYFFGLDTAGLCGIIDVDNDTEIIFGDDPSISEIIFFRSLKPIQEQALLSGVHQTASYAEISNYLGNTIKRKQTVHYLPPYRHGQLQSFAEWMSIPLGKVAAMSSITLIKAVVRLRSVKSPEEIGEIEKAVDTTVRMQLRALEMTREGMLESEVAGAVEAEAIAAGGSLSFPTILTVDGQVLHNHFHGNNMEAGKMLLCDCGAESVTHYAADLTRTFPVSGSFTTVQKEIYQIVLNSYSHAVSLLRPGILFRDVHKQACIQLAEGLKQIGLMKGDAAEAVEAGAHALFFPCGLGHMLGLDVHDMESLGEEHVGYTAEIKKSPQFGLNALRLGRQLEAGFVLTIEPGIYCIPRLMESWEQEKKFEFFINYQSLGPYKTFGGIRIEDDYVIMPAGYRRLGERLPTAAGEIEDSRKRQQGWSGRPVAGRGAFSTL